MSESTAGSHVGLTYRDAVHHLIRLIQDSITSSGRPLPAPIRMYIAGGTCLSFYIEDGRVTDDVDAAFSRKVALPENLEVAYQDAEGNARFVYFDRQYNDTLGLLHENAYPDSHPHAVPGIDPKIVDVRLLTPLDLAVSKLSRYSEVDQADIAALAARKFFTAEDLRARGEEALGGYVGNVDWLTNTIALAAELVREAQAHQG